MGGTIQMIPEKGEAVKIKAVLKDTYICPAMNKGEHVWDFWVEWYGNRLEFSYTCFDGNGEWAKAVAMELCRRFKIKKAGWDSVGYCDDMQEFMSYRPMEVMTKYIPKFTRYCKLLKKQGEWMEAEAKKIFEEVPCQTIQ